MKKHTLQHPCAETCSGYRQAAEEGAQYTARLAVALLRRQHEGCQPGTLVSYRVASDVLEIELREELERLMKK